MLPSCTDKPVKFFRPMWLALFSILLGQVAQSAHVFLPRNYHCDMNADMEVLKKCGAKAIEQRMDVFEFTNNQWNEKDCVVPKFPERSKANKTFFEKLPSSWGRCSCRADIKNIKVMRNRQGWESLPILFADFRIGDVLNKVRMKMKRHLQTAGRNTAHRILNSKKKKNEIIPDRLPNNVQIRFLIGLRPFQLKIYDSAIAENCIDVPERFKSSVCSCRVNACDEIVPFYYVTHSKNVRVEGRNGSVSVFVNQTLHAVYKKSLNWWIVQTDKKNRYVQESGFVMEMKPYKSSGILIPLPTLIHMTLNNTLLIELVNRRSREPTLRGCKVDSFEQNQLFFLYEFYNTTTDAVIAECDYVCMVLTEWASIRSGSELQIALQYMTTMNATTRKIEEIPIALLLNEDSSNENNVDRYVWNDETPIAYNNWKDGAPSKSLRKYVVMNLTDGTWTDVNEDHRVTACLCRNTML